MGAGDSEVDDFKPDPAALSAQCREVLAALQAGAQSTSALRRILGPSSSPAARVLDLRKAGHVIATERTQQEALYVLRGAA